MRDSEAYRRFKSDIKSGVLSHCYLFFCPDDDARISLLYSAAADILGIADADVDNNISVTVLSEKPKFAEVQKLVDETERAVLTEGYRVFIIPYADGITAEGQNKLLKTLEEPKAGTVILMGAQNETNVLATVRSRAKKLWLAAPQKQRDDEYRNKRAMLEEGLLKLESSRDLPDVTAGLAGDPKHTEAIVGIFEDIAAELIRGESNALSGRYNQESLAHFYELASEARKKLKSNCSPQAVADGLLFGILEVCYKCR